MRTLGAAVGLLALLMPLVGCGSDQAAAELTAANVKLNAALRESDAAREQLRKATSAAHEQLSKSQSAARTEDDQLSAPPFPT